MNDNNQYVEKLPDSIGRYEIKACLGFGAMGAVYRAFDPLIKRTLAIKTIRLDIPRQSPQYKSFIERFYHEARISGTLSHPNIVTLYDIGEESGVPFLAMEFADGETISAMIERGVRFSPERVVALISQIASAIDYAHGKGVIHRDIKPSNLILCEGDRVKVTDFGIAKLADAEMTQSGVLLGTPAYMSPEQAMGDKLDGRSDIFSLGICAFEMLSGEQPFPGNNVTAILYKVVHVDPIEPANLDVLGLLPDKWRVVFNKALAKKPDDRYQTAAVFVQELEYCLGSWFGSAVGDETTVVASPAESAEQTEAIQAQEDSETGSVMEELAVESDTPSDAPAQLPSIPSQSVSEDAGVENLPLIAASPMPPSPVMDSISEPTPPRATSEIEDEPTVLTANVAADESKNVAMSAASDVDTAGDSPTQPVKIEQQSPQPTQPLDRSAAPSAPTIVAQDPATVRVQPPAGQAPPMIVPLKKPVAPSRPPPSVAPVVVRKRRSSGGKGWIAISASGAAIVLVTGGLLGFRILSANRERSKPHSGNTAVEKPLSTPPAPSRGTLRVLSTPVGAEVYVNGEGRGITPLVLTLPLGLYDVRIMAPNHDPQAHNVELSAVHPMVELHAKFAVRELGDVTIVTTPPGASVFLDGRSIGTTPIHSVKLDVGQRAVEIQKDGYRTFTKRINVVVDRHLELSYELDPVATPSPKRLEVDTERVYLPQDVDVRPKKSSGPHPDYPDARKLKAGESASVTVHFVVGLDGSVSDIEISESGGSTLDKAAISAIRNWRFEPGVKRGIRVKVRESRRFTFRSG